MATWTRPTSGKPKASIHESCRTIVRAKPGSPRLAGVAGTHQPEDGTDAHQGHPAEVGDHRQDGPSQVAYRLEQGRRCPARFGSRDHDGASSVGGGMAGFVG